MTPDLARMVSARRLTALHIAKVRRQIAAAALDHVCAVDPHPRLCGQYPGATNWRASDARLLTVCVAEETERRRPEVEALTRRLARQDHAIITHCARRRLNVDPFELVRRDYYS